MRLGTFMMPLHPPKRQPHETYVEDREAILLADKLGYAEALVGEQDRLAVLDVGFPRLPLRRVQRHHEHAQLHEFSTDQFSTFSSCPVRADRKMASSAETLAIICSCGTG